MVDTVNMMNRMEDRVAIRKLTVQSTVDIFQHRYKCMVVFGATSFHCAA